MPAWEVCAREGECERLLEGGTVREGLGEGRALRLCHVCLCRIQ